MSDPVRDHLRHLELLGRSELTISARRRILARLAAALPCPLAEATEGDLYDWRASLRVSGPSAAAYLSHVKEYYRWLVARGERDDDPAAMLPVPKIPRRLPRPISEEDLAVALAAAPPRIRLWLVLAAWCGLRAREIAMLRAECVSLAPPRPVLLVDAGSAKGRRERAVPLSEFAVAEITAAGLPRSGWAFRRADGRAGHVEPWLVSKLAARHLHDCGIPASLHQLRHRFGTEAYAASLDLRGVQELLGHASPQTTAGYAAVTPVRTAAIVASLPVPGSPAVNGRPGGDDDLVAARRDEPDGPGVVTVRLLGEAADIGALLSGSARVTVARRSRPYANRDGPGVRVYLTLVIEAGR